MREEPLVSIIVPAYNVEEYIEECLDSIIAQTYRNIEIIVVDDGSTDSTGKICDHYCKRDNRIIVIHQMNKGPGGAKKTGLTRAKGQYVGFVDSDDTIKTNMFEELVKKIQEYNVDFVHSGYCVNNTICETQEEVVYNLKEDRKEFICDMVMTGIVSPSSWSKLYRRELVSRAASFVEESINYGEDLLLLIHLCVISNSVLIVPNSFYNYRVRNTSLSNNSDVTLFCKEMDLFKEVKSILTEEIEIDKKYYDRYLLTHMMYVMRKIVSYPFALQKYYCNFEETIENSNVVIWGAGQVGKDYYCQLSRNRNICIVGWFDSKPKKIASNIVIEDGSKIGQVKFDYVVIAVENRKTANEIRQSLLVKDICEQQVIWERPKSIIDDMY